MNKRELGENQTIGWNFNMFLVAKDGESCTRYANSRTPSSVRDDILAALEGHAASAPTDEPASLTSPQSVVDS